MKKSRAELRNQVKAVAWQRDLLLELLVAWRARDDIYYADSGQRDLLHGERDRLLALFHKYL